MKIFEHVNGAGATLNKSDIQIQSSCAKLGIKVLVAAGVVTDFTGVELRLKHVSSRGTVVLVERMKLVTLMEICAAREGFYIHSETMLRGTIDLTSDGRALDLQGGYLSLDIDTKGLAVTEVVVNTIDSPEVSPNFLYYNPVYVNGGVTKEIDLQGVKEIALPAFAIESIQLSFPARSITYLQDELSYVACDMNDVTSIDGWGLYAKARHGYSEIVNLPVPNVNRMTVTPAIEVGFYLYLLETKTL